MDSRNLGPLMIFARCSLLSFNMPIDTDPQPQKAASPLVLVVRSFLRYVSNMNQRSICEILLSGFFALTYISTMAQEVGTKPMVLSPLVPQKDFDANCGTYIYIKGTDSGDSPFLAWTSSPAQIRINGKLTKLNLDAEKYKSKIPGQNSVGDIGIFRLSRDHLFINITTRVSGVCPADLLECESVKFDGEMIINMHSKKQKFAIRGMTGC